MRQLMRVSFLNNLQFTSLFLKPSLSLLLQQLFLHLLIHKHKKGYMSKLVFKQVREY